MNQYMFLLRTEGDCTEQMTPEAHSVHLAKVIAYIDGLKRDGRFVDAQPLSMKGTILRGKVGALKDGPFIESKEIIAGYFLILARSLDEAVGIAGRHPLFEDSENVRFEIREVKRQAGIN